MRWMFSRIKERIAAAAVMHAAGRENITFMMGLRSRRRKMVMMRLVENAITKYTIPSRKRSFHKEVLPGIRRRPMVERINTVRSNPIAGEPWMSTHRLYSERSGRRTEKILEIEPQVVCFTGRNEHAGLDIWVEY